MAAAKSSVFLSQTFNPRYDASAEKGPANDEFIYRVDKAVNTLRVRINQYLTTSEVQQLIDDDVQVTIGPAK